MIAASTLSLLCCPETRQPLSVADESTVQALNRQIEQGALKNRSGVAITVLIDGGLTRQDRKILYPVRNGIPVLLVAEGIALPAVPVEAP